MGKPPLIPTAWGNGIIPAMASPSRAVPYFLEVLQDHDISSKVTFTQEFHY